jgi:predicted amidohydrolase
MRQNTDRMLSMIDSAVAGSAPFLPVRLVVFPEFAHAAPVFAEASRLIDKLAVEIPNEHTDRIEKKAREHGVYIQTGTMLEIDKRWKGALFNTTCLIGPEGILYKYRKVNTWIPYEVHTSPHDIEGYDEPLFPVADTPIGRIGCAVCYDCLHGPVERDRPDGLVDGHKPGPCDREHGLRRRVESGREPVALSAVLVVGREPDRRF